MVFKRVHSFEYYKDNPDDGATPAADLLGVNGTFYGTTYYGGSSCDEPGCGTVFSVNNTSITVYSAGSNGNVAPMQDISGVGNGYGMALDSARNMYVANLLAHSVEVYAAGATGNVAPIRMIAGSRTKLDDPSAVALDAVDDIYVTNNGAYVTAYQAGVMRFATASARARAKTPYR